MNLCGGRLGIRAILTIVPPLFTEELTPSELRQSQGSSGMQSIHRILRAIWLSITMLLTSLAAADAQVLTELPDAALDSVIPDPVASSESAVSPGYWIVDSYSSPQDFEASAPVFCSRVTRYDRCTGFRRTSIDELTHTIQPGIPVCIFCHGSFVGWEDVLKESCETWKWLHKACLHRQIQMIYFSWPSDRPVISPIIQFDVNRLGRRAGRNGFYMANLIQQIPSECPVCLIGHSHGTRVITSSLHLLGGGSVEDYTLKSGPYPKHRLRSVFAASAMDHNWMNPGYRYDRALCSVECILNLRNSCDPALFIYPLRRPFSGGALGYTGVTRRDRNQLGYSGNRIQELNLTEEIGPRHYWPNYFRKDWLAQALRSYLFFDESQRFASN